MEKDVIYWEGEKPLMRGYIHRIAFLLYLVLAGVILWFSRAGLTRLSMLIYLATLINLYGISSVLHLTPWCTEESEMRITRVDHASIFLLIAGSYTPICLSCAPAEAIWPVQMLISVWIIAILGVIKSIIWTTSPRAFNVGFYFVCGLTIVPYGHYVLGSIPFHHIIFYIVGGALYLIGGLVYGARFPNPSPAYFGFHEIFHTLTVVANLCFLIPMLSCMQQYPISSSL